jgi:rRNA-processing arch domain
MAAQAETYREAIAEALIQSPSAQQILSPGRIVVVKSQSVELFTVKFFLFFPLFRSLK